MKNKAITVILLLTLTFFSGCDDNGSGSDDALIMPLAVGNSWHGILTTYAEDGSIMFEQSSVYYVTGEYNYNNQQWFEINHALDGDTAEGVFVFRNNDDGLYALYETDSSIAPPVLWAKHPASKGDEYYSGPGDEEFVEVTDVNVVVPVLDVNYICNVYEREAVFYFDFPPIDVYSLGPNIGFVKIERHRSGLTGPHYLFQVWELNYYLSGGN